MTQLIDKGSEAGEYFLSDSLDAQRIRAAQGLDPNGVSAHDCAVCLEPISRARRAAVPGVQTCIECQIEIEHAEHVANGGHR
jgi:phage/conjugal plasmid C-4 type zinc finger TraR family protein